jgi:hypothetical protein
MFVNRKPQKISPWTDLRSSNPSTPPGYAANSWYCSVPIWAAEYRDWTPEKIGGVHLQKTLRICGYSWLWLDNAMRQCRAQIDPLVLAHRLGPQMAILSGWRQKTWPDYSPWHPLATTKNGQLSCLLWFLKNIDQNWMPLGDHPRGERAWNGWWIITPNI